MKIERYLTREFGRWFLVGLCLFVVLSLVIEFFEKIDDLIDYHASVQLSLSYFAYRALLFLLQFVPLAVLFATLVTLILWSRSGELLALLSCGISPRQIALPFLFAAMLFSCVELAANEYLLPALWERTDTILNAEIKKKRPVGVLQRNQLWFRSRDNYIWRITFYYPREAVLEGVTLFQLNTRQEIVSRIDAQQARWENGNWYFFHGVERLFTRGNIQTETFTQRTYPLQASPYDLQQIAKEPEKMSISELYAYLRRLKERRFDATVYLTDLHEKIAFPFVNLVMALVGLSLSLHPQRGKQVAWGIGFTLGIGFLYWALFSLSLSFGKSGRLHPLVAAWGPNVFFATFALWRILR